MNAPLDVVLSAPEGAEYIGRCIYCPHTPPFYRLSREHVAPAGLSGTWELIAASCSAHRELTSYIEMRALDGPLEPIRLHKKMYGPRWRKRYRFRHPGGDPDDPVIAERFLLDDGSVERVEIPVSRHPYSLEMPRFDAWPAILDGGTRSPYRQLPAPIYMTVQERTTPDRLMALFEENPRRRILLPRRDDENVMKMLAKIGYCFALYLRPKEPFRPLILEYINSPRGDNSWGRYFVGGPIPRDLKLPDKMAHAIQVREEVDKKNPKLVYLVARIQLFNFGFMPVYDVVLGTRL